MQQKMGARRIARRRSALDKLRPDVTKGRRVWTYRCPQLETYRQDMSDRAASHPGGTWGAYIDSIPARKGITLTEIAKRSGIARNTFYKWKRGATGVTVDSVKRVAQAAGDDEQYALRAAGGALIDDEHDPQLAAIYAADITEEEKRELVEYVLETRRRNDEDIDRNLRLMIRSRGGQAAS